jgi:WD40-like Beta Propeller Repeat
MRKWIAGAALAVALVGAANASAESKGFTPWSVASNLESVPGTSPEVNTPFLDGCPFTAPDGRSLYIASNRPGGLGGIDIWVARREHKSAPWGAPQNLEAPINSAADDFCPSPTRGRKFFFVSTRAGGCGESDIYLVLRRWDGWGEPENLGCQVNSSASEAGPVLLKQGRTRALYFSSTRPGGFAPDSGSPADADIYVSVGTKGREFAAPVLAPGLNSEANDARPHLSEDGREIVFDSDRAGTLGGPDLWSSTRTSLRAPWALPVNLGPSVNSPAAETRASFADDGRTLYFGSTRPGSEPGPTGAPSQDLYVASREPLRRRAVNCASPPHNNLISGTLEGDLEISLYGTVCVVTGTVRGDVTVRNADPRCQTRPPFVALDLQGGTIEGDVTAAGEACVMVWLGDRALVTRDIAYEAEGNLGFLGNGDGAVVRGNVYLGGGFLWATGTSTTNRIDGKLSCRGGHPVGSADLATATNWDGAGLDPADRTIDIDGTIGGRFRC